MKVTVVLNLQGTQIIRLRSSIRLANLDGRCLLSVVLLALALKEGLERLRVVPEAGRILTALLIDATHAFLYKA